MINMSSILIDVDAYKVSMFLQYPPKTQYVSSYIEARKNPYQTVTWYGLQHILHSLTEIITVENVNFAKQYWEAQGLPFNYDDWMYIATELGGKLPLRIQAAPEGLIMGHSNVLVQVVNTDPRAYWLTTWVETKLMRVWYPTTVASLSADIKKDIMAQLNKTSDAPDEEILFKLHDFGARGVSSVESAGIGGSAHLLNFMGSDTGPALWHAMVNYKASMSGTAASIPAAEHSTVTSWGQENEVDSFKNMIDKFGNGLVAVVSDSYDIYNATKKLWGGVLRQQVIDMDGMLIVRPDSGDPEEVPVDVVRMLADAFGTTLNSKGYMVLNNVRVIQGDGINQKSINAIMNNLEQNGFSITNIAFGMGGALLQGVNRDTMSFAMKASAICIDGEWQDVFKDPITDSGKRSKRGRLSLTFDGNSYVTKQTSYDQVHEIMQDVFVDGVMLNSPDWNDVVSNARN